MTKVCSVSFPYSNKKKGVIGKMKFRHEIKHNISYTDYIVLRQRLSAIAKYDTHGENGHYHIRSIYFDDIYDTALMEKINGIPKREKFRLRYYDEDISYIRLEKKSKENGLCHKEMEVLTLEETKKILNGETEWLLHSEKALLKELYYKMTANGIRPKTIIDYERDAFVYPAGNVRITLDYNIRTGMRGTDFLNAQSITVPVELNTIILEVKWDEFLPGIIRDSLGLEGRRDSAYSKYAAGRIYG